MTTCQAHSRAPSFPWHMFTGAPCVFSSGHNSGQVGRNTAASWLSRALGRGAAFDFRVSPQVQLSLSEYLHSHQIFTTVCSPNHLLQGWGLEPCDLPGCSEQRPLAEKLVWGFQKLGPYSLVFPVLYRLALLSFAFPELSRGLECWAGLYRLLRADCTTSSQFCGQLRRVVARNRPWGGLVLPTLARAVNQDFCLPPGEPVVKYLPTCNRTQGLAALVWGKGAVSPALMGMLES